MESKPATGEKELDVASFAETWTTVSLSDKTTEQKQKEDNNNTTRTETTILRNI
jgi:hypothetical protein